MSSASPGAAVGPCFYRRRPCRALFLPVPPPLALLGPTLPIPPSSAVGALPPGASRGGQVFACLDLAASGRSSPPVSTPPLLSAHWDHVIGPCFVGIDCVARAWFRAFGSGSWSQLWLVESARLVSSSARLIVDLISRSFLLRKKRRATVLVSCWLFLATFLGHLILPL
jgi:hypothetical protein